MNKLKLLINHLLNLNTMHSKRVEVIMLSSDICDKSQIALDTETNRLVYARNLMMSYLESDNRYKTQQLYVVSDDRIRYGDSVIITNQVETRLTTYGRALEQNKNYICKKVVASTEGYKLPIVPCMFIEHFINMYNDGNLIIEIEIQYNCINHVGFNTVKTTDQHVIIINRIVNTKPVFRISEKEKVNITVINKPMLCWDNDESKATQRHVLVKVSENIITYPYIVLNKSGTTAVAYKNAKPIPDFVELTVDEISEILGKKVKIIGHSKNE